MTIWCSDDYGATWNQLADFGPYQDSNFNTIGPYGTGYIKGDLSRLSVQTDSGFYVSTDEGVHWKFDGGPTYLTNFSNDLFYSAKGVTYGNGALYGKGLWKEDWSTANVGRSASETPSFHAKISYPSPSETNSTDIAVLVHCNTAGHKIVTQIYNVLGVAIGEPASCFSDGQAWDRIPILAPHIVGTYFIRISVDGVTQTLHYTVE